MAEHRQKVHSSCQLGIFMWLAGHILFELSREISMFSKLVFIPIPPFSPNSRMGGGRADDGGGATSGGGGVGRRSSARGGSGVGERRGTAGETSTVAEDIRGLVRLHQLRARGRDLESY